MVYLYVSVLERVNLNSKLYDYKSPEINKLNLVINDNFTNLFLVNSEISQISNADDFFSDLGLNVVGIIAIEDNEDQGFVMLESNSEQENTKIYRPGDLIAEKIYLQKIKKNKIVLSYDSENYQISLADNDNVTSATGVVALDVTLLEILPYLRAESGEINNIPGVFISDTLNGKILKKLNLKQNDFLYNLNGHNVFNLATLNDAYIKLQNKKDIVATLYRNGELKKIVARRLGN
tara:strand:+ start:1323 stop:2027 length:705 start_codon:yes stop_codon:yes gene_type:complete